MEDLVRFMPIIGIALLFWLLIIRPASRRQRELVTMQGSLQVGDEVMLTSGIYGSVVEVAEDHLRVQVSDGVTLKVARGAIGTVIKPVLVVDELEEN